MQNPKISIITITYNSGKIVERAIQSILDQNYANLEYIVVDGGSTDNTLEIIHKYDEHIDAFVSEKDQGISDAFNKGISMATGDVVGIINCDDGLLKGALDFVANNYDEKIDVYRGNLLLWKEDTDTKSIEKPSLRFRFGAQNNVSHASTFISKKTYDAFGSYDLQCKYFMDLDLFFRFQNKGATFKHIDETLAFFSLGGLTFNSAPKKRKEEMLYILKKNGATKRDIFSFLILDFVKSCMKKAFKKEKLMKIKFYLDKVMKHE